MIERRTGGDECEVKKEDETKREDEKIRVSELVSGVKNAATTGAKH